MVDNLGEFMLEEDINSFLDVLRFIEETELKLVKKSCYQDILSEIQKIGEAAKKRQQEYKLRPVAIDMFGRSLQAAQKLVDSFNAGNEELNHLDPAEVDKVQRAVLEKQEWLKIMCADIEKLELTSQVKTPSGTSCLVTVFVIYVLYCSKSTSHKMVLLLEFYDFPINDSIYWRINNLTM